MSWLPVANIHGVVEALASISPKYTSQTNGLNLSKPAVTAPPDGTNIARLPRSGRVGVGNIAGQYVEIRPRRGDLVHHVGRMRDRRIVVGLVVGVVVVAGGQTGRQSRRLVGALVADHREPERAGRLPRGGHRRRRRPDVADEAVVGAPLVEVRRATGESVDRDVRVELLRRQHPAVGVGNLGDEVADLRLDRRPKCRGRTMVDEDLEAIGVS